MIVRALDRMGDWTFGQGKSNYISNNDAVTQNIQTRLSSFIGDCFFDLGSGINWFFYLGGSKNQLALNLAIAAMILNTSNVIGIRQLSVNLDHQNRSFSISYRVQTTYSVTGNSFIYNIGAST